MNHLKCLKVLLTFLTNLVHFQIRIALALEHFNIMDHLLDWDIMINLYLKVNKMVEEMLVVVDFQDIINRVQLGWIIIVILRLRIKALMVITWIIIISLVLTIVITLINKVERIIEIIIKKMLNLINFSIPFNSQ